MLSSEPEAIEEKTGWKATQFIGSRCDSREYRGGDVGSQEAGSSLRLEREVGVALSSSDFNAAFWDSRSIIYGKNLVRHHSDSLGISDK